MDKGREEPRKEKIEAVKNLAELIERFPVVGMLEMKKMPAAALQKIRYGLKGDAVIKIPKRNILLRALEGLEDKKKILETNCDQPGLILSKLEPFKLYKLVDKKKSAASAKPGDIAITDIEVKAGPTDLMPGPAISSLSKVKIMGKIDKGKIAIMKDVVVCKTGEKISEDLASALNMLKLMPMEVGLNIVSILEDGTLYGKDVLAVDEEKVLSDLILGYHQALNLSVNAGYPTKENIELIIAKVFREAKALSLEAGIVSKEIIGELLAKAVREAKALEEKIPEVEKEEKKEEAEKKEETKAEEKPKEGE
ncbi:MAG: 50S ribosomal protein L10 [Candidatus Aenigmarchaeota archaeon]|nr:50S ribosomal protein L10 [Candidatus Aenigmarchaeota archaeon]